MNKKSVSLKRKIILPMLIIIVITPILTLLAFNITMNRYTRTIAQDNLKSVLTMSRDREDFLENITDKRVLVGNVSLAVRANRFNSDISYALLDSNFNKVENKKVKSTVSDDLITNLQPTLNRMNESKIRVVNYNNTRHAIAYINIGGIGNQIILFVSSTDFAGSFIRLVNLIIISITILTLIIGLALIYRINKGVVKPINELCTYTQQIAKSNFIETPISNSFAEIHELSEHMSDMSQQLKQSTDNQNNLMQNISHEIRTPLMSIQSYAEGIKEGVFKDIDHATSIIRDECTRLNSLVNQLLLLSKIENQNYESDVEELDFSNTLLEYLQSLNGIAVKHNIVLNLTTNEKEIFIRANDTLLTQIVYNIVSNGVRYAKSKVDVALTKNTRYAILTITDDGNGFNDQDIQHVFDRFYKGEKGKFGLGLTIAKSAVEFLGGSIKVENAKQGARFTIQLPLAD